MEMITHLTESLIGVQLPKEVNKTDIKFGYLNIRIGRCWKYLDLPEGDWQIVGWSEEIKEDQAICHSIVDKKGHTYSGLINGIWQDCWQQDAYYNYKTKRWNKVVNAWGKFFTAEDSFKSLLQHHNITENILILKRI